MIIWVKVWPSKLEDGSIAELEDGSIADMAQYTSMVPLLYLKMVLYS